MQTDYELICGALETSFSSLDNEEIHKSRMILNIVSKNIDFLDTLLDIIRYSQNVELIVSALIQIAKADIKIIGDHIFTIISYYSTNERVNSLIHIVILRYLLETNDTSLIENIMSANLPELSDQKYFCFLKDHLNYIEKSNKTFYFSDNASKIYEIMENNAYNIDHDSYLLEYLKCLKKVTRKLHLISDPIQKSLFFIDYLINIWHRYGFVESTIVFESLKVLSNLVPYLPDQIAGNCFDLVMSIITNYLSEKMKMCIAIVVHSFLKTEGMINDRNVGILIEKAFFPLLVPEDSSISSLSSSPYDFISQYNTQIDFYHYSTQTFIFNSIQSYASTNDSLNRLLYQIIQENQDSLCDQYFPHFYIYSATVNKNTCINETIQIYTLAAESSSELIFSSSFLLMRQIFATGTLFFTPILIESLQSDSILVIHDAAITFVNLLDKCDINDLNYSFDLEISLEIFGIYCELSSILYSYEFINSIFILMKQFGSVFIEHDFSILEFIFTIYLEFSNDPESGSEILLHSLENMFSLLRNHGSFDELVTKFFNSAICFSNSLPDRSLSFFFEFLAFIIKVSPKNHNLYNSFIDEIVFDYTYINDYSVSLDDFALVCRNAILCEENYVSSEISKYFHKMITVFSLTPKDNQYMINGVFMIFSSLLSLSFKQCNTFSIGLINPIVSQLVSFPIYDLPHVFLFLVLFYFLDRDCIMTYFGHDFCIFDNISTLPSCVLKYILKNYNLLLSQSQYELIKGLMVDRDDMISPAIPFFD